MAKGYELAKERKDKLNLFGKNLARRAKSTCELCGISGEGLHIHEVKPIGDEPNYDQCLFICESCRDLLSQIDKADENQLRFLNEAIWSEVPIVKALALKIANMYKGEYSWVEDLIDTAYVEDEIRELADRIVI